MGDYCHRKESQEEEEPLEGEEDEQRWDSLLMAAADVMKVDIYDATTGQLLNRELVEKARAEEIEHLAFWRSNCLTMFRYSAQTIYLESGHVPSERIQRILPNPTPLHVGDY